MPPEPHYPHEDLTRRIIGAFYAVYNELGYGYVESVYEHALSIALIDCGLASARQSPLTVWFRKHAVGRFRADVIVENAVILELKAMRSLESSHEAQLLNLLRSTQLEVGLLMNFGPRPQIKRMVFSNHRKRSLPES